MDRIVHTYLLFDRFALDLTRGCLRAGDRDIELRRKVFEVLRHLAENAGRLVPKQELIDAVWPTVAVGDESLVQCIRELRNKLGDDDHRLIKLVPRRGYLLNATLKVAAHASEDSLLTEAPALALPDRPSVAVLRFANVNGDPEQEHVAEGLAEDIITSLSRCDSLSVTARNSKFAYRGEAVDVRRIGRELGVHYVLEGCIRRTDDYLRVSVRLVETTAGVLVWADRFDGSACEVLKLQDRITECVVAAVEPTLQSAELVRLKRRLAVNPDTYALLVQAQALEGEYTSEGFTHAIRCLEQAVAIDPSDARAMALAAFCYAERRQQGWSQDAEADTGEGLRHATRALEIGRHDANVLWMSAFAVRALSADSYRARELVTRSLQLNPHSIMALTTAAWGEVFLGNPPGALELLQRAQRLSPRDPKVWYMTAAAALAYFSMARYEEAARCAKRALAQNPRFAGSLRALAASLAKLGRVDDAAQVGQQLLTLDPRLTAMELRWRLRQMHGDVLNPFVNGLRIAGLPQ
jgi:TolB-like protein/Flp pilus assembly protein TadD